MLDKAKALVAAGVAFGASWIAARWGLNVPEDAQVWIASAITALITGAMTWAVPNKS